MFRTDAKRQFTLLGYFLFLIPVFAIFSSVSQGQVALNFNDTTPTLETGVALSAGARYRFDNVAPGTDALVTIASINGGAILDDLDDNATGDANRFQPRIRTNTANSTGWVRFDFQLVATGTSTLRAVPGVLISAQDIDANPVREFVEIVNTQAVTVASPTLLVSLSALAGGTRYGFQNFTGFQTGIGTDNRYEMYTSLANTATSFTIIGGSDVGATACVGTSTTDTCSRRHSYVFDPASSNATSPNPNVSITKTGPASVNIGGSVSYTLVARNLGTTTAHGSTITDNVPTSLTGVIILCAATGGAVCPSTTGLTTLSNVFIPTFPNGGQLTFTISGTASVGGTISNVATIAPPNGSTDPTPANNTSPTVNTTVTPVMSGTVFEDVNYGGGAGRDRTSSSGVVRPNVRVELYNATTGAFVNATTTDSTGLYQFAVAAGNYRVRVVNAWVTSSRTGACAQGNLTTPPASCTQLPIQTFRVNSGVADTARVGGERPSVADTGAGGTGAIMNASGVFTTAGGSATLNGQAQSISSVTLGTTNVTGVDFGYNFDTIVNTNDSGQGSLRQFIINSNALTGNASLAQSGSTISTRGATSVLPAGKETSIFMIPNGAARPGLLATVPSQLTSGVAVIQLSSAATTTSTLPIITDSDTIIDGGTQTFNIANSNTLALNSASTVGIDGLSVPAISGPEVQVQPTAGLYATAPSGLRVTGTNTTIQNLAIYGFTSSTTNSTDDANIYIATGATGALIRWNVIGTTARTYADPGATARTTDYGVLTRVNSVTIRENLVAFSGAGGVELYDSGASTLVEANELRSNAVTNVNAENLNINTTTTTGAIVRGNLSVNAGGPGFDTSGATNGGNTFENNTVTGNGILATGQTPGLRILGPNNIIRKNIIGQNYGAGVLVRSDTTNTGNLITQNSIYANGTTGTTPTKQIGIDLNTDNTTTGNAAGTFPFVTVNDANDTDTGPNNLLNFPIFESVSVIGSNVLLTGCAPVGATIELFEADVSPGKSSTPGANTNAPRTLDYGEGETYLTTLTEGVSDTDTGTGCAATDGNTQTGMARFAFLVTTPTGVASGDKLTATATVSSSTSEFSSVATVTATNIGLAKALDRIVHTNVATDNSYTLVYRLTVENFGSVTLSTLEMTDDVVTLFSALSPTNFNTWVSVPANAALLSPAATLTRSGTWNGTASSNILTSGQSLAANSTGIVYISFDVTVNPAAASPNNRLRDNSATARGTTPSSTIITDTSTNGTDPDGTDNDNIPDENIVTPAPFVKLVKEVRNCGNSLSSCSGSYGTSATGKPGDYLEYRVRYFNISSQAISQLRVSDTLAAATPFQEDTYAVIAPNVADFNITCPNASTVDLDRSNAAVTTTPASGAITAFNINIMAVTACNLTTVTSGQQGQVLFKVRIP